MRSGPKTKLPANRFWEKVNTEGACWFWQGSFDRNGYGQFFDGRTMVKAHRFAWLLMRGPHAAGLVLDHLCRQRSCVNPTHMEPVTQAENNRRGEGWSGRNARVTHCPNDHEYTEANTRIRNGSRECRSCGRGEFRR